MEILEKPNNLTVAQEALYEVMREKSKTQNGFTIRELMNVLDITNSSVIYSRLQHLQNKGAISGYIDPSLKTQVA